MWKCHPCWMNLHLQSTPEPCPLAVDVHVGHYVLIHNKKKNKHYLLIGLRNVYIDLRCILINLFFS